MILVDVQVPAMDQVYDFELDEELTAGTLAQDIGALVAKKEKASEGGGGDRYLYSLRQDGILKREETLKQQGVRDGDRLILI